MTFTTDLIENPTGITFATQLEADLATGVRGGNKARLVARCWVAIVNAPGPNEHIGTYEEFRAIWITKTFATLHQVFDHMLPVQFRWDKKAGPVAPAPKKELSKKAQKMAKSFAKTKDLTAEQRQWVIDHGGVEALDNRKQRVVANGATFAFLDGSWFIQAQIIQACIDGRKELV